MSENKKILSDHALCLAPMMGITNRHFRYLIRLLSKKCRLYTEMLPAAAIGISKKIDLLKFDIAEKPLALQIASNDIKNAVSAAKIASDMGYDEINLNIGCPSPRTNQGGFGLCLFNSPDLVAQMVDKIQTSVNMPVSIKTRIGIGYDYRTDLLHKFVAKSSAAGCKIFIIHARLGILENMSTKKNLNVPPLNYGAVYELKKQFPELKIIINGAIKDKLQAKKLMHNTDGVMIGRALAKDAFVVVGAENTIFDTKSIIPPDFKNQVIIKYLDYATKTINETNSLTHISAIKPLFSLFFNQPGAKFYRQQITNTIAGNKSIHDLKKDLINARR